MLKAHEIIGTDKPIFREKSEVHFFLDEITQLGEKPSKYSVDGYVQVIKEGEIFFKAVYSLDKSYLKYYNKSNLNEKRKQNARIIRFPQKNV